MVGFQNLKCILLNNFYVCGPTWMKLISHLDTKVRKVNWHYGFQGSLLVFCPFIGFQILPYLKIFVTDFSGTMKARKLKVLINMENDWMYRVYRNRGQGFITLGDAPWYVMSSKK